MCVFFHIMKYSLGRGVTIKTFGTRRSHMALWYTGQDVRCQLTINTWTSPDYSGRTLPKLCSAQYLSFLFDDHASSGCAGSQSFGLLQCLATPALFKNFKSDFRLSLTYHMHSACTQMWFLACVDFQVPCPTHGLQSLVRTLWLLLPSLLLPLPDLPVLPSEKHFRILCQRCTASIAQADTCANRTNVYVWMLA